MDPTEHSLHDAWIERVVLGPRREITLEMDFGSARISDPALPEEGVLRLGAIENFETVRRFFAELEGDDLNSRIDEVRYGRVGSRGMLSVKFALDPQGEVEVRCAKIHLVGGERATE